ncbi:MAG: hypothetical protein AVO35_00890 [Candidatus Aegiribacteria sp. MLS_C]|nr:MAG: hypothetical protein AVO35_00890 [Candidatus Aegiribacteria sp. MLS_C]
MRVFVALSLPGGVLDGIERWKGPLAGRYPSLSWVSRDRMHMTLRFYGDIPRDSLGRINGVLEEWTPGPLKFTIGRLGSFGSGGSPSVYWLGGEFPPEVVSIARRLGKIPDDRGRVAGKVFVPHLTVARRRSGIVPLLEPPDEMAGEITEVSIIDSMLTSGGPEYTYLRRYGLHNV